MSKEGLSKLIQKSTEAYDGTPWYEQIADYLLANGVYVLPCKIGDYIEWDTGFEKQLHQVRGFYIDQFGNLRYSLKDFSPIVKGEKFLRIIPREEAEKKLKESESE